ncbi:MAG TPA: Flp family type IVb pilin [Tepidiformaceae bacterium]|nr:Flp family type IVb pilin [Tepidiformaceae bacterium]
MHGMPSALHARLSSAFRFGRRHTRAEDEGQGLVEYGLILALVALVVVGALGAMGVALRDYVAWDIVDYM